MTVSDKVVAPAYAVEQTLEAMEDLSTVHMRCRDWHDDEYEMWIQLDAETGIPEYCRAYWPNKQILNISRPDCSYQYNERGKVVQINSGKLYRIGIAPAKIFEMILAGMNRPNIVVEIYDEYDAQAGKNLIVAVSESPNEDWKVFIDPETKLPVRMHCLKLVNKMGSFFKDIEEIEFNVELPDDIFEFEIPEGVKIIDHDHNNKLLSDPQHGMPTDGLTEQEAAERIVTDYWNALIAQDEATAGRLCPVAPAMVDGSLLAELVEVGELYVEPGCGIGKIIPCTLRFNDGSLKSWNPIVRSRNINGIPSCVIVGCYGSPREKK